MIADYDAPLTEGGDYTAKYWITRKYFLQVAQNLNISHPTPPEVLPKMAYDNVELGQQLTWHNLVSQIVSSILDLNKTEDQDFSLKFL